MQHVWAEAVVGIQSLVCMKNVCTQETPQKHKQDVI